MRFARFYTHTATTKRSAAAVSNKFSPPVSYLSGVPCSPPYPVSPDTLRLLNINTPNQIRICYTPTGYDVREGDLITISGYKEYTVVKLEKWEWPDGDTYVGLYLEDFRG